MARPPKRKSDLTEQEYSVPSPKRTDIAETPNPHIALDFLSSDLAAEQMTSQPIEQTKPKRQRSDASLAKIIEDRKLNWKRTKYIKEHYLSPEELKQVNKLARLEVESSHVRSKIKFLQSVGGDEEQIEFLKGELERLQNEAKNLRPTVKDLLSFTKAVNAGKHFPEELQPRIGTNVPLKPIARHSTILRPPLPPLEFKNLPSHHSLISEFRKVRERRYYITTMLNKLSNQLEDNDQLEDAPDTKAIIKKRIKNYEEELNTNAEKLQRLADEIKLADSLYYDNSSVGSATQPRSTVPPSSEGLNPTLTKDRNPYVTPVSSETLPTISTAQMEFPSSSVGLSPPTMFEEPEYSIPSDDELPEFRQDRLLQTEDGTIVNPDDFNIIDEEW